MSVFLERTLFYRRYPLPHASFSAVAACLRTEYRKLVPLAKTLLEDDFEDESLRDFVEDRNPPLSIRFSVRRDDIQTVMTPEEFETLASEPFSYDQIAVILFLDVDGSMLAFTAGLDGSLRLMIDSCRPLTRRRRNRLFRTLRRRIYLALKPAAHPVCQKQRDPLVQSGCDKFSGSVSLDRLDNVIRWVFGCVADEVIRGLLVPKLLVTLLALAKALQALIAQGGV